MDEAGKVDMQEKHTLHQLYPSRTGWLSLLFLVGNAALQVYSHVGLSAVIISSVDPNAEASSGPGLASNVCVNDTEVFMPYWETGGGKANYSEIQLACGQSLVLGSADSFATCMRGRGWLGTDDCLACFQLPILCTSDNCLLDCLADRSSPGCIECQTANDCNGKFQRCAGVPVPTPNTLRTLQADRSLQAADAEEDTIELFVVYNISFISSVRDAANGGAWGIAIVIVAFSGIWPYAKNLIMLIAWFVPMTASTRSAMLKNLTRLAKWSLVDVFAIVIILAGVRIDKTVVGGDRLLVFAESRIAIYTFCVAAIWDLVQGEWMRLKHLEALSKHSAASQATPIDFADVSSKSSMIDVVTFAEATPRRCSTFGRLFLLFVMLAQIGLAVASVVIVCISFSIGGLLSTQEGPNFTEYSASTIASSLSSPEALELNSSIPGTLFLMLVYLLCAVVIPLFEYVSILAATFLPWNRLCCGSPKRFARFCTAVDIVGGFACQDVFILSFLVVAAEWNLLIAKAVGSQTENIRACAGESVTCIEMFSQVELGIYIMIPAVVLGWIMELFFTYSFAQTFHPVEQVKVARVVFGCLVPAAGCATSAPASSEEEDPSPGARVAGGSSSKTVV